MSRRYELDGSYERTVRDKQVTIRITKAMEVQHISHPYQQEIDLGKLVRNCPCGLDGFDGRREEIHFMQVAQRWHVQCQHFVGDDTMIARGRRVVLPQIADRREMSLKHGRELWLGYLAQLQVVDGPRTTLNLNLVASVGLQEMPAIELLAQLLKCRIDWVGQLKGGQLHALKGETGFKNVKVQTTHSKRIGVVKEVSDCPASQDMFDHAEWGNISVEMYFKKHYDITLQYPQLPCLHVGRIGNRMPMELCTVLGGEHNLLVGKLHPDYLGDVVRKMAMKPDKRCRQIQDFLEDSKSVPRTCLFGKGFEVDTRMIQLNSRILKAPDLKDGHNGTLYPNSYAKNFKVGGAKASINWALWCFCDQGQDKDLNSFAGSFLEVAKSHGLIFENYPVQQQWRQMKDASWYLPDMMRELRHLNLRQPFLLVVLLPAKSEYWNQLKSAAEIEGPGIVSQCMLAPNGPGDIRKDKLNNIILKLVAKLPRSRQHGFEPFAVYLKDPHPLLDRRSGTMVLGADVTHMQSGISIAAAVASCDSYFMNYFGAVRAQSAFVLGATKQRRRLSEERILLLHDMVVDLLTLWKARNNALPEQILYYRDGVSNGQFAPVMKRELNDLKKAFTTFRADYSPHLVIIVGQKRHGTRFFSRDGKAVTSGTVADAGIATPGHPNFYLVAQEARQGTPVPCHYHVLHKSPDLNLNIDEIQILTYQLHHLYSRADKTVSYSSPAYLADHLCERGKTYFVSRVYMDDVSSVLSLSSEDEQRYRDQVDNYVNKFNREHAEKLRENNLLQGSHFFC